MVNHLVNHLVKCVQRALSAGLPLTFTVVCFEFFDAELLVDDCVGILISIISFHLISDIDWIFGLTVKFIVFLS